MSSMGRLVVVDGLDGSGKSTQLARLDAHYKESGVPYRQISFPDYDNPSSTLVKMYLDGQFGTKPEDVNAYAASSFYAVDRYASYKQFWQENYQNGGLIVAARYTTSNAIHQMSKLPKEQWDSYLSWLQEYEYGLLGLPRPDCVIFLDMPPEVADALVMSRYQGDSAKKDIHERDVKYLAACRPAAMYAAEKLGWRVISCAENGAPRAVETITADILKTIEEDLVV